MEGSRGHVPGGPLSALTEEWLGSGVVFRNPAKAGKGEGRTVAGLACRLGISLAGGRAPRCQDCQAGWEPGQGSWSVSSPLGATRPGGLIQAWLPLAHTGPRERAGPWGGRPSGLSGHLDCRPLAEPGQRPLGPMATAGIPDACRGGPAGARGPGEKCPARSPLREAGEALARAPGSFPAARTVAFPHGLGMRSGPRQGSPAA
jgi:hypothetical protein